MDIYAKRYENINFITDISDDVDFISIDKIQIHQVITNLLENAIKFSTED